MKKFVLEVCVDSIESAINAINGGASRIEVCSSLNDDGLTPSIGLLISINKYLDKNKLRDNVKLFAMIRPRPGDFVYSYAEVEQMLFEVKQLRSYVSGFVFGILQEDGILDSKTMNLLIDASEGRENTFHRAMDYCKDPYSFLVKLINLGFKRVLTSGQKPTAVEGIENLKKILEINNGRLKIAVAGGITDENCEELFKNLDTNEYHCSAKKLRESKLLTDTDKKLNYYIADQTTISNIVEKSKKYFK